MHRIICTASCAGFFKVLNERWEGKTFAFFSSFSVSSFVSLYLIIQLKYVTCPQELATLRFATAQLYHGCCNREGLGRLRGLPPKLKVTLGTATSQPTQNANKLGQQDQFSSFRTRLRRESRTATRVVTEAILTLGSRSSLLPQRNLKSLLWRVAAVEAGKLYPDNEIL